VISPTAIPHPVPPGLAPDLTVRQGKIIAFMIAAARGCPPSMPELCEAFGITSRNGIACHFAALVRKGYLAHERPAHPGAYRILRLPHGTPVVGWQPITREEST
jgi:SOS-response transcriptional repressor LexA